MDRILLLNRKGRNKFNCGKCLESHLWYLLEDLGQQEKRPEKFPTPSPAQTVNCGRERMRGDMAIFGEHSRIYSTGTQFRQRAERNVETNKRSTLK